MKKILMLQFQCTIRLSKVIEKEQKLFWNYYRHEANDFTAYNYNANPIKSSESLKYKTRFSEKDQM